MPNLPKNALILVILLIVAYFALSGSSFLPKTIIGSSLITFDGSSKWISSLQITQPGETITYNYAAGSNVLPQILPDGRKITANFVLTFAPETSYCKYGYQLKQGAFNLYQYYLLTPPEKHLLYSIASSKGGKISLDAGYIGTSQSLTDALDGKGQIVATNAGYAQGLKECPAYDSVVVINNNNNLVVVDLLAYNNYISDWNLLQNCGALVVNPINPVNIYICQTYFNNLKTGSAIQPPVQWVEQFNGAPVFAYGGITGYLPRNLYGVPQVVVTADADYFDAIAYSAPKPGVPIILYTSPVTVQEGSTGTIRTTIKNDGDLAADFSVEYLSQNVVFSKPFQTVNLASKQSVDIFNSLQAQAVSFDVNTQYTVKLCSSSQASGQVCAQQTGMLAIINKPDVPTIPPIFPTPTPAGGYCGDSICNINIGETPSTCSVDCKITLPSCDPATQMLVGTQCICKPGLDPSYQQNQQTGGYDLVCKAPSSGFFGFDLATIILVIGVGIVGFLLLTKKKRRR